MLLVSQQNGQIISIINNRYIQSETKMRDD